MSADGHGGLLTILNPFTEGSGTLGSDAGTVILDAASASHVTIPFDALLLTAQYARDGDDLVLSGEHGATVVVKGYFALETPPTLVTELGAQVEPSLAYRLANADPLDQYAQAAGGAARKAIGEVTRIEGSVTANHKGGGSDHLVKGAAVYEGDEIVTGSDGKIVITFTDDTRFGLGVNARMTLDHMVYNPAGSSSMGVSMLQGAFTFVSGKVAKTGPDHMKIVTPVGTLGIRGTDGGGFIAVTGQQSTIFLTSGIVNFSNPAGAALITPGTAVQLFSATDAPTLTTINQDQIDSILGGAYRADAGPAEHYAGIQPSAGPTSVIHAVAQAAQTGTITVQGGVAGGETVDVALTPAPETLGPGEGGGSNDLALILANAQAAAAPGPSTVVHTVGTGSPGSPLTPPPGGDTSSDTLIIDDDLTNSVGVQVGQNASNQLEITITYVSGDVVTIENLQATQFEELVLDFTGSTIDNTVTIGAVGHTGLAASTITILGGPGNDIFDASGNTEPIGGVGSTYVSVHMFGNAGNDTLIGGSGNDILSGGPGVDILFGMAGNDTISGGDDSDLIEGGPGADVMNGDGGLDTLSYNGSAAAVTVNLGAQTASGGDAAGDTFAGFENLIGSPNDDVLTGSDITNIIDGGAGNDIIDGGAGADVLIGGLGNDTLLGGAGNDILTGLEGADVLDGGDGIDTADYSASNAGVTVALGTAGNTGGHAAGDQLINIEAVNGSAFADSITGDANDNLLFGAGGADTLDGGAGADTLIGGLGNDTVQGGTGNDAIFYATGEGFDTVDGGPDTDTVTVSGLIDAPNVFLVEDGATYNARVDGSLDPSHIAISVNGVLALDVDNVEDLVFNAGDAGDTLTIVGNFSGTDLAASTFTFNGGAGIDTLDTSHLVPGFNVVYSNVENIIDNAAPVAQDDAVSTTEDAVLAGNVLADNGNGPDSDVNADTLTVTEVNGQAADVGSPVTLASGALLTLNSDGTFSYDPNGQFDSLAPGQQAVDNFTYTISDGALTDTATATVTINGVNDPAVIGGDVSGAVLEDAVPNTATGALTATDVDNTDNVFQAVAAGTASDAGHGTYEVTAGGAWTYTLNNGDAAVDALNVGDTLNDTFTVLSEDGTAQQVSITINGANDPAVIGGDVSGAVTEDAVPNTTTGALTAADVDNTDNVFQAVAAGTASDGGYGTYQVTAGGAWTYTLNNGDAAVDALNVGDTLIDTFTVQSADGTAQQVSITINGANDAAAIGGDVSGAVLEDAVPNTATGALTATDVDNTDNVFQPVAAGTASDAGHGTYEVTAGGAWTYTLNNGDAAVDALNVGDTLNDTFTVLSEDGTAQQVSITINGANDAAVIGGDVSGAVLEDAVPNTATGALTATDVDNTDNVFQAITSATASDGGYGTYQVTAGGVWTYTLDNTNATVNGLNNGDSLNDTFTVLSEDGTAQQVSITINGANDAAAIGGDVSGAVTEDAEVDTATGTLTATDSDNPANSFQAVAAGTGSDSGYGTYEVTAGGAWTYTLDNGNANVDALNNGDSLSDSFTVLSADGTPQQVSITINGANDAAVIGGDVSGAVTEDAVTNTATGTLTATDVDNTDNVFQVAAAGTASDNGYGTYEVTAGGAWTYTLDNTNTDVNGLNNGDTLNDTFTVLSEDGTAQQVSITINGANDPAVIGGDVSGAVTEDVVPNTATGALTATDVDNTNNVFQVAAAGTASDNGYGTYEVTASGAWTYTLNNGNTTVDALNVGGSLNDTFTVLSEDGTAQQVSITINGANDPAVIGGDVSGAVTEDVVPNTATGALTATDVDNTNNLFQAVTSPTTSDGGYGTYQVTAGGAWTYTLDNTNTDVNALNNGDSLNDTFTVLSADGTAQLVSITINGANDAPNVSDAGGTLAYTEGDGPQVIDASLTVTDVDNASLQGATVSLTGYVPGEDVLAFTDMPEISGVWSAETGTLTLSGTATLAQYAAALETVTYENTNQDNPSTGDRTVSWQVDDGTALSNVATSTITVGDVNDAPTLTTVNNLPGTEDVALTITFADLIAAADEGDVDGTVVGFRVEAVTAGALAVQGDGAAIPGSTVIDGDTTVVWTPVGDANGVQPAFTIVAIDDQGAASAAPVLVSADLTPVNDAPSFALGSNQEVNEDAGLVTVAGFATNISAGPADESGQALNFNIGTDNDGLFAVGPSIDPITGNLTFTPADDANGSATVTVSLSDDGGTANGGVDTSGEQTFTITIDPVNDAPVATGAAALASVREDSANPSGDTVATLFASTFSDVDGDALAGVAIVGDASSAAQGAWQWSSDGTSWSNVGTVGDGTALVLNATDHLRFVPAADFNGAPGDLTARVWDGTSGTAGAGQDITGNTGGTGAFSTGTVALSTSIDAVNDAPENSVPGEQPVNEDGTLIFSTANENLISVTDPDVNEAGSPDNTLQVTLAVGNGSLTLGDTTGLTFGVGDGADDAAMTFAGTAAAINAALDGLSYSPNGDYSGADTLTITTNDLGHTGSGGPLEDIDQVAIGVTAVADAPILDLDSEAGGNQAAGAASGVEDTPIPLDVFAALTDTDGSETLSVEIGGVPVGATLTDGENVFVATEILQTVDATNWSLENLTISPPLDNVDDFQLSVTARATESLNEDMATTSGTINVTVDPIQNPLFTGTGGDDEFGIAFGSVTVTLNGVPTTYVDPGTVTLDGLGGTDTLTIGDPLVPELFLADSDGTNTSLTRLDAGTLNPNAAEIVVTNIENLVVHGSVELDNLDNPDAAVTIDVAPGGSVPSSWEISENVADVSGMVIGRSGSTTSEAPTDTLNISGGGIVSITGEGGGFHGLTVGGSSSNGTVDGKGALNISGASSMLSITGETGGLNVGYSGVGTMIADAGASVLAGTLLQVGRGLGTATAPDGSAGRLTVNGDGTTLSVSGVFGPGTGTFEDDGAFARVGFNGGEGILNVTGGANVSIDGLDGDSPGLGIGGFGGQGTVNVSGTGEFGAPSQLSIVGDTALTGISVGFGNDQSFGTLNITDGGQVAITIGPDGSGGVAIGGSPNNTGGHGEVLVSGDGSSLTLTGPDVSVNLGRNEQGQGTLTVADGGHVSSMFLNVGYAPDSDGTMVVRGLGSLVTLSGARAGDPSQPAFLNVGRMGTGELTIDQGGQFLIDEDGTGNMARVGFNVGSQGDGTLHVDGIPQEGDLSGTHATLQVNGNYELFQVGRDAGASGVMHIANGGQVLFENPDGEAVGFIGRTAGATGTVLVDGAGSFLNLDQSGLGAHLFVGYEPTSGTPEVGGQGTLTIGAGASVNVSSVADDGAPDVFVGQDGIIDGNGSLVGDVLDAGGTIAPGLSIGTLSIDGNVNFAGDAEGGRPGGTFEVEMAPGLEVGETADFLNVSGTASFNSLSTVDVALIDGLTVGDLQAGDYVDVLTAASIIDNTGGNDGLTDILNLTNFDGLADNLAVWATIVQGDGSDTLRLQIVEVLNPTITGTGGADEIGIEFGSVTVNLNGVSTTYPNPDTVTIDGGGGVDTLTIDDPAAAESFAINSDATTTALARFSGDPLTQDSAVIAMTNVENLVVHGSVGTGNFDGTSANLTIDGGASALVHHLTLVDDVPSGTDQGVVLIVDAPGPIDGSPDSLIIQNGGVVEIQGDDNVYPRVLIGGRGSNTEANSSGTMLVTGEGSHLTFTSGNTPLLLIGRNGVGEATIADHAVVDGVTSVLVGTGPAVEGGGVEGTMGTLTVNNASLSLSGVYGANSGFDGSGPFLVAGRGEGTTGVVNVINGASVTINPGQALDAGDHFGINVGGNLNDTGGTGVMTISGGSSVDLTGTNPAVTVGRNGGDGTLTVTGAPGDPATPSTLSVEGTNAVLHVGLDAGSVGQLDILDGGQMTFDNVDGTMLGTIGRLPGGIGSVTVDGAGSLLDLDATDHGGARLFVGFNGAAAVPPAGGEGTLTIGAGATVNVNGVADGGVTDIFVGQNGTIDGNGTLVGDVLDAGGTISPGASIGALTIDGNFTLNAGALNIELGTGGQSDVLNVDGTVFANGGTLNISFIEGYTPTAGDTFTIVHANAIVGEDTTVDIPTISNLLFEVHEEGGDVSVAFANAGDDSVLTNVADGSPISIPVAALFGNDYVLDSGALSIQSVGSPSGDDQVSLSPDGSMITYDPAGTGFSAGSFNYTVVDEYGGSDTAMVNIGAAAGDTVTGGANGEVLIGSGFSETFPSFNIVYVVDVSGSMGTSSGVDIGGTPANETFIQVTQAALQNLNSIYGNYVSQGGQVTVHFVPFDSAVHAAAPYDVNYTPAGATSIIGDYTIAGSGLSALVGGGTIYGNALTATQNWLTANLGNADQNVVYFLSDGAPSDSPNYAAFESFVDSNGVVVNAVGIGNATATSLNQIDNTGGAEIVTDPSQLSATLEATVSGNDVLQGGGGNDFLYGNSGNDTLNGGDGNDVLTGNAGNDALTGGPGNDIFQYQLPSDGTAWTTEANASQITADTITDFTSGQDQIVLNNANFQLATTGPDHTLDSSNFVVIGGNYDGTLSGTVPSEYAAGNPTVIVDGGGQVIYDANGAAPGYTVLANVGAHPVVATDIHAPTPA